MSTVSRIFIRNHGAVIPETAIGTIMFETWNEVSYEIDRSNRELNPMVNTLETVYASATLTIVDETIAKQLFPEDEDDEDEDEEEEEEKKPKRRGRPSKKVVVEEKSFEPVEMEIVFFRKSFLTNSEPLNVSAPIAETSNLSDKNERIIEKHINNYGALFMQLESIRENLAHDVEGANGELASAVEDMIGAGAATTNLQQSAIEQYRDKVRRQEARVLASIDEALDWFQKTIDKRAVTTEAVPLAGDITVGDVTESALSIVTQFFNEEVITME